MNIAEDDCAVKIAVRERPLREIFKNNEVKSAINYHSSNSNILIVDERIFAFDHVLSPNISQEELFNSLVMPLVDKVLQGFHCTALAYGQTGTGKSFTMGLNPESIEGVDVGMIPRCVQAILNNKTRDNDIKYEISASFIEIYSEKVFDLLGDNPSEPIIARGYKFTGGTKKMIETVKDGYNLLHQGTKNRHVRPTKMNTQSSRSHAIFTIYVRNEIHNKITQSCLNLVDLAGSEGVRRTGHQGVALSEGVHINQGLLSIGKVLQAITHSYKVIPYRDSVLSSVLQDSLNPNSYFTLLACISPHREDLSETLSTIRFAQNAKNLKHNPQINSKLMELKKSKTPYKMNPLRPKNTSATPQTCKRPMSLANFRSIGGKNKPTYHGNTFCTPNKKRKTENPVFNRTVVGLTPKEKQKIGTVKMPISKVLPFSYEPSVRESINSDPFNDLDLELDSRASSLSLNISSSTTIDAPPSNKPSSPIVRKCIAEVESTFKSSMALKNSQSVQKPSLFNSSPMSYEREKIRTIIRQELFSLAAEKKSEEVKKMNNFVNRELYSDERSSIFKITGLPDIKENPDPCCSQTVDFNSTENLFNSSPMSCEREKIRRIIRQELFSFAAEKKSEEIKKIDNCVNRELFSHESSPVFKIPVLPDIKQNPDPCCSQTVDFNSTENRNFLSIEETVIPVKPLRRSRRISTKTQTMSTDDSLFVPSLSVKSLHDSRRRSIRLISRTEKDEPKISKIQTDKPTSSKNSSKTMKSAGSLIKNPTIAGYFDKKENKISTNLKTNLAKHQKAILDMLNTASMRELQYLPQIGLKTAFQIVTQRTLHGKFKSFVQVSKLPIWRGKAWERFREANSIS